MASRCPTLGTIAATVEEGKPAPTFTPESASGEEVSLESFRGQPVVLCFYTKDDRTARNEVLGRVENAKADGAQDAHLR